MSGPGGYVNFAPGLRYCIAPDPTVLPCDSRGGRVERHRSYCFKGHGTMVMLVRSQTNRGALDGERSSHRPSIKIWQAFGFVKLGNAYT